MKSDNAELDEAIERFVQEFSAIVLEHVERAVRVALSGKGLLPGARRGAPAAATQKARARKKASSAAQAARAERGAAATEASGRKRGKGARTASAKDKAQPKRGARATAEQQKPARKRPEQLTLF